MHMMMIVETPPPNDAQLNWSQAAPVDWSMFLNEFPFDWELRLTGGWWVDSLDPMLTMIMREELEVMEM